MKESFPSPLHLVPETRHVLQGYLSLRGHCAAPLEGEGLGRLEPDLLPLKGPGRLLRRYGPDMEEQGQRTGPATQVEGAKNEQD